MFKYAKGIVLVYKISSAVVEDIEESNLPGPEKAKIALDGIGKIWHTVVLSEWPKLASIPADTILAWARQTIDVAVYIKNATGAFDKSSATA